MEILKEDNENNESGTPIESDFFERSWDDSWAYIKTVVDVVREPVLILDKDLCVMSGNESFYSTFQVDQRHTEKTLVYELGNGQWNIPSLKRLLENILPNNTFFKGYEVAHDFPSIGRKIMILNARQIHRGDAKKSKLSPIIMLAMEDVTEMMNVADTLSKHTNDFEVKMSARLEQQESIVRKLEEEIREIKGKNRS